MDEKEMQKKYMEYNLLDQKIKELQEKMEIVEQQLGEINNGLQTLEEFSNITDNKEILVPINNGIFAKATIKKEDKVLVNIGSSVVVDKTITETKALIEKQHEELAKIKQKITENITKLVNRAGTLEKELNEIMLQEQ